MLIINIEDDTIKMVCARGIRATSAIEIPLGQGLVQSGVIIDKKAVSGLITRMLVENRLGDREAIACVSAAHSIYRVVKVPKLDRRLMDEASRKEMERLSPVPLDTLHTSWQDIKISGTESALCLLGLPRDNVDSVVDTMTLTGLKLKSLELKPLAVSRVIDEKTAIVVNIQLGGFDITIVESGIPELIRSLTFPGAQMSDIERSSVVREELVRTVNFYNASHKERLLDNDTVCFISGLLPEGISENMGYTVKPLPSPVMYPGTIDQKRFAANTGMILGVSGSKAPYMKVNMNIVPRRAESVKVASKPSSIPLIGLILGALVVIGLFVTSNAATEQTAYLEAQVNTLTKSVTDKQAAITRQSAQGVNLRDQYVQTLDSLETPLAYVEKQRAYSMRDLGTVTSLLPGIMYLTMMHDDGALLVLEGTAPSSDMILNYAHDLKQSNNFRDVAVTAINNEGYSVFRFVLALTLNR